MLSDNAFKCLASLKSLQSLSLENMSPSGELTMTSALEQYLPDLKQLKSLSLQMNGICQFPLEVFLDNPLLKLQ